MAHLWRATLTACPPLCTNNNNRTRALPPSPLLCSSRVTLAQCETYASCPPLHLGRRYWLPQVAVTLLCEVGRWSEASLRLCCEGTRALCLQCHLGAGRRCVCVFASLTVLQSLVLSGHCMRSVDLLQLVTGSGDGSACLWDVRAASVAATLSPCDDGEVHSIAIRPRSTGTVRGAEGAVFHHIAQTLAVSPRCCRLLC